MVGRVMCCMVWPGYFNGTELLASLCRSFACKIHITKRMTCWEQNTLLHINTPPSRCHVTLTIFPANPSLRIIHKAVTKTSSSPTWSFGAIGQIFQTNMIVKPAHRTFNMDRSRAHNLKEQNETPVFIQLR